jgi:hypothetical protein
VDPDNDGADEPLIHQPDMKDNDRRNGLQCFLNMERECGPDCMSYTTKPSESPDLNSQQRNCVLIVGLERLGRHTGILAKRVSDAVKHTETESADRKRAEQKPPRGPMSPPGA